MTRYFINTGRILLRKFLGWQKNRFHLASILEKNFPPATPFYFIQAGAWDGTGYDFLYTFVRSRDSTGIVIEPLPDYFEQLKINYSYTHKITAINKAVYHEKRTIGLFRVDPEKTANLPDWAGGIASLDPVHHKKANIPSSVIISQQVQADTLKNIVEENYPYKTLHLFQVDVEGYDYEILKQLDFSRINPDIIRFEYINLTGDDVQNAIRLLKQHAYYCFYDDIDVVAIKLRKIKL